MPRPRDLTRELAESILAMILGGAPPLTAAKAHGVAESTWYEWLARGRDPDHERNRVPSLLGEPNLFAEFAEAVDAAVPAFEVSMVRLAITKARTAQEALAILERHPGTRETWRPPARAVEQATTITGPDGGPVRVEVARPETEQELRDRLDSLIEFLTGVDGGPAEHPAGQDAAPQRGSATGGPRAT